MGDRDLNFLNFLNEQGLKDKINLLIIVVGIVMFACSITVSVISTRNNLTQAAQNKLDEVTELAYSIAKDYKQRADNKEMSETLAKKMALKAISNLRYQGSNYIWVNDYDNKFLVHPTKKGTDTSLIKDRKGRTFIVDLTNTLKNSNKRIFINYEWPKLGHASNKLFPKISTGRAFHDWEWIMASGIYIDEIETAVSKTFWSTFWINLIALTILAFIARFTFIQSLNKSLREISQEIDASSSQIAGASSNLEEVGQRLAEGTSEQAASIQETSATLEESASMIQQNNQNTQQAAILAKQTKEYADNSHEKMDEMVKSMSELKVSSDEIGKIIRVIEEIAFQTNILALNAAVEAARAGEAGLGFAVVAEEVRNLAQRSAQAAHDTTSIIEGNIDLAEKGVKVSQIVFDSLSEIDDQAKKVSEILDEIAVATSEQTQGIQQINKAISQMETVLQANSSTADESAASSQELSAQTQSMNRLVEQLTELVDGKN